MSYALATRVQAYELIAEQPFSLGWALSVDDGTSFGAPQDMDGVTDARVSLQMRVPRGVTPPAPVIYTLLGGEIAIGTTTTVNGGEVAYPLVELTDASGQPAGLYDLIFSLTCNGEADPVLRATVNLFAQP